MSRALFQSIALIFACYAAIKLNICGYVFLYFYLGFVLYMLQKRLSSFVLLSLVFLLAAAWKSFSFGYEAFEIIVPIIFFLGVERALHEIRWLIFNFSVPSLFGTFLCFASVVDRFQLPVLISRISRWGGSLTYSSYMIHLPRQVFILFLCDHWLISRDIFDSSFVFSLYLLMMLCLSRIVFIYFERPIKLALRAQRWNSE